MPRAPRPIAVAALAEFLGCVFEGDGNRLIHGFGSLSGALSDELVFVRDASHLDARGESDAAAVLAPPDVDVGEGTVIRSPRPAHDFSRLVQAFAPLPRPAPGIDPRAFVDATASIDESASVAAGAFVGPDCRVGARSIVSTHVSLTHEVEIGADCWIHPGCVLRDSTRLGDRVVLQPGVVLGGDGFGVVADASGRPVTMAQRGRVVVEDDVEIGANSTVDRATLDETRIRRGAKIDNLVQIAHNCDVGEDALIVAQTGLAGGTVVGAGAVVMAQAGSAGHLRIGERAFVGARAGLHRDVPDGARVFGSPQMEERTWHRVTAALKRLPDLMRRVRRIEATLKKDAGKPAASGGDSADAE